MRPVSYALLVTLLAGTASAATAHAQTTARALIQPTTDDSPVSGQVTLTDTPEGLEIIADISGAAPGLHGLHIHQFGVCDDAGAAAGGHYNPDHTTHGFAPKDGFEHAHPGDLGNITIGDNSLGHLEITVPGLSLVTGDYAIAGRAIVLHAQADDFGQPTGNAGGRIGCGPIVITGE